jgi:hypothetical protein
MSEDNNHIPFDAAKPPENPLKEIKERIDKGDFLYEPSLLTDIRSYYANKKVVVLDIDGILRGEELSGFSKNDDAEEGLKSFKEKGYSIIFWSFGTKNAVKGLDRQGKSTNIPSVEGLVAYGDFTITGENYSQSYWKDPNEASNKKDFENAVDTANWLHDADVDKTFLKGDTNAKHPELLFPNCCMLDDGGTWDSFFTNCEWVKNSPYIMRGYDGGDSKFIWISMLNIDNKAEILEEVKTLTASGNTQDAKEKELKLTFFFGKNTVDLVEYALQN